MATLAATAGTVAGCKSDRPSTDTPASAATAAAYGLICFVPDVKDGKPHLVHGMIKTIKVS